MSDHIWFAVFSVIVYCDMQKADQGSFNKSIHYQRHNGKMSVQQLVLKYIRMCHICLHVQDDIEHILQLRRNKSWENRSILADVSGCLVAVISYSQLPPCKSYNATSFADCLFLKEIVNTDTSEQSELISRNKKKQCSSTKTLTRLRLEYHFIRSPY